MLLDADSINGIDMGGMEVHGLAIARGETPAQDYHLYSRGLVIMCLSYLRDL